MTGNSALTWPPPYVTNRILYNAIALWVARMIPAGSVFKGTEFVDSLSRIGVFGPRRSVTLFAE
jgi:hypothetical protein